MNARSVLLGLASLVGALLLLLGRHPDATRLDPAAAMRAQAAEPRAERSSPASADPARKPVTRRETSDEGARLVLHVRDARTRAPVPGPQVSLLVNAASGPHILQTGGNREGVWEQQVAVGQIVELTVKGALHRPRELRLPPLEPGDRAVREVFLEPFPRSRADVRVVDAIGRGVSGARIQLFWPNEGQPVVETDRDGLATLDFVDALSGRFGGLVAAPGFVGRSFHGQRTEAGEVQIERESDLDLPGTIALDSALTVHGRVVDAAGRPVDGAAVRVSTSTFHPTDIGGSSRIRGPWESRSRADGAYEVEGIPCGVPVFWQVTAPEGDRASAEPLALGPKDLPCDWQVAPPLLITGRVVCAGGVPLEGLRVDLVRRRADAPVGEARERVAASAYTGAAGGFELPAVERPGPVPRGSTYELDVRGEVAGTDYSGSRRIELVPGERSLRVELEVSGSPTSERRWPRRDWLLWRATCLDDRWGSNRGSVVAFGAQAAPYLALALEDGKRRQSALGALARMEPEVAVPILISAYLVAPAETPDDELFKQRILAALGSTGGDQARAFCEAELTRVADPSSDVAIVLAWAAERAAR